MGKARMRELKRAAPQLGVTSTILRQQGWKTASPARVRAVRDDPPEWLAVARERRPGKHQRRDRVSTAARLGIQPRAVRERGIKPGEVGDLLAARPSWLIAEQQRRQAQLAREADGKLRRELADALVTSVHEVWFQELKTAVTDADIDAIDARWAPQVRRARQEALQLASELSAEQVRARIGRERDASHAAACYRAGRLLRRALEG
jgi:Family of unknown function (DUF5997)